MCRVCLLTLTLLTQKKRESSTVSRDLGMLKKLVWRQPKGPLSMPLPSVTCFVDPFCKYRSGVICELKIACCSRFFQKLVS